MPQHVKQIVVERTSVASGGRCQSNVCYIWEVEDAGFDDGKWSAIMAG